jgi:hypothetical protein
MNGIAASDPAHATHAAAVTAAGAAVDPLAASAFSSDGALAVRPLTPSDFDAVKVRAPPAAGRPAVRVPWAHTAAPLGQRRGGPGRSTAFPWRHAGNGQRGGNR